MSGRGIDCQFPLLSKRSFSTLLKCSCLCLENIYTHASCGSATKGLSEWIWILDRSLLTLSVINDRLLAWIELESLFVDFFGMADRCSFVFFVSQFVLIPKVSLASSLLLLHASRCVMVMAVVLVTVETWAQALLLTKSWFFSLKTFQLADRKSVV